MLRSKIRSFSDIVESHAIFHLRQYEALDSTLDGKNVRDLCRVH